MNIAICYSRFSHPLYLPTSLYPELCHLLSPQCSGHRFFAHDFKVRIQPGGWDDLIHLSIARKICHPRHPRPLPQPRIEFLANDDSFTVFSTSAFGQGELPVYAGSIHISGPKIGNLFPVLRGFPGHPMYHRAFHQPPYLCLKVSGSLLGWPQKSKRKHPPQGRRGPQV